MEQITNATHTSNALNEPPAFSMCHWQMMPMNPQMDYRRHMISKALGSPLARAHPIFDNLAHTHPTLHPKFQELKLYLFAPIKKTNDRELPLILVEMSIINLVQSHESTIETKQKIDRLEDDITTINSQINFLTKEMQKCLDIYESLDTKEATKDLVYADYLWHIRNLTNEQDQKKELQDDLKRQKKLLRDLQNSHKDDHQRFIKALENVETKSLNQQCLDFYLQNAAKLPGRIQECTNRCDLAYELFLNFPHYAAWQAADAPRIILEAIAKARTLPERVIASDSTAHRDAYERRLNIMLARDNDISADRSPSINIQWRQSENEHWLPLPFQYYDTKAGIPESFQWFTVQMAQMARCAETRRLTLAMAFHHRLGQHSLLNSLAGTEVHTLIAPHLL